MSETYNYTAAERSLREQLQRRTEFTRILNELIDDPTCEIEYFVQVIETPNQQTGWLESGPGKGRTLIVKVHGGGDRVIGPSRRWPRSTGQADTPRTLEQPE